MKQPRRPVVAAVLMMILATSASYAQRQPQVEPDPLRAGFQNPPQSARPRVWWHWMNGNITEAGIKLDLEWMHRIGIAGFQCFDAALSTPQVVEKRLAYMTPEWQHAFKYAAALGAQLGLEEAIAGSPGWSESGGPWVPPAQGMKKYVWSETVVDGGAPFKGVLRHPPANTGPFQNIDGGDISDASRVPHYYADALVVAYRNADSDVPLASLHPKITASSGAPHIARLADGDLNQTAELPAPPIGESAWIQYEFERPTAIRAVTLATRDPDPMTALVTRIGIPEKWLEASLDGHSFHTVARFPEGGAQEHTLSFAPVTAKFFRVSFKRTAPPPLPPWAQGMDLGPAAAQAARAPVYRIAELVLHRGRASTALRRRRPLCRPPISTPWRVRRSPPAMPSQAPRSSI